MSKCISKHGEYSEHELSYPEDPYCCQRCLTVDEDAIMAALRSAEAERDRLAAKVARVEALAADWERAYAEVPLPPVGVTVLLGAAHRVRAALAEEPLDA